MLRTVYMILALSLLLAISHAPASHQPITIASPQVTQMAQPRSLLADGVEPEPPPIPLAQPHSLLADGVEPEPPPIPLAQPHPLLADGVEPEPPPIPLALSASLREVAVAV